MSVPLFTHGGGGCKPLMDLHPDLRDHRADRNGPEATDTRAERAAGISRPVVRRARLAALCVACAAVTLGATFVR